MDPACATAEGRPYMKHPPDQEEERMVMIRTASAAVALAAAFVLTGDASAQVQFASASAPAEVTYSGNVAAIIQQNCIVCHRPDGIAPMNLLTYEDARRYANRIRTQVSTGEMPP